MRKIKFIFCLLILILSTIGVQGEELNDFWAGRITVCFSLDLVGNSRGEININIVDGVVQTPFEWFNELAFEYQITNLERKYWVKDQEWNLNGQYPMNIFRLETSQHNRTNEIVSNLILNSNVLFAELEPIYRTAYVPNDPGIIHQWYLDKLRVFYAWDIVKGSPEIIIGIVDTGIKWNHPDLKDSMWINEAELPGITINWDIGSINGGDGIDNDGNGKVDDVMGWDFQFTSTGGESNNPYQAGLGQAHGTMVAGASAAVGNNNVGLAGIAFNTRIIATKHTPFNDPATSINDGLKGITYMADTGVHIINCSWGGIGQGNESNVVVSYAKAQGSLVVAAVGNSNKNITNGPIFPACTEDAIAVAAVDQQDQRSLWGFYSGSNYGSNINISAPGSVIYSTFFNSTENYDYVWGNGTSMSSPIVAGVAALIKSMKPEMTVDELRHHLLTSAVPLNHHTGLLGTGRVDAYNAVLSVITTEIISDTIITNPIDLLNKHFVVRNGAKLTIIGIPISNPSFDISGTGSEVIITSSNFPENRIRNVIISERGSFRMNSSTLSIENGSIDFTYPVSNFALLNNSVLNVYNSTINVSNRARFIVLSRSKLNLYDDSKINLVDRAWLSVQSGDFLLSGSTLELSDKSIARFQSDSLFESQFDSKIIGNTAGVWGDPYNVGGPAPGNNFGDRIEISSSRINFQHEVEISSGSGEIWDGIFFIDTHNTFTPVNTGERTLRGNISGIRYIGLFNSDLTFRDSKIQGIDNLYSTNNSVLRLLGTFEYIENARGIYLESQNLFAAQNMLIKDTAYSSGLNIRYSPNNNNIILNSNIHNNAIDGINVYESRILMIHSEVRNNGRDGINITGSLNSIIRGDTHIHNNNRADVYANKDYFPIFQIQAGSPLVSDEYPAPDIITDYFLYAYGPQRLVNQTPINPPIDLLFLRVNVNMPEKFFPCIDSFQINHPIRGGENDLFLTAIELMIENKYQEAFDLIKIIVLEYPESYYAKQAVTYLPALHQELGGSVEEIILFLEREIRHEKLLAVALETRAMTRLFNNDFHDSIYLFHEILNKPPSREKELLAELNQAYSYFQLVSQGANELPEISLRKPRTREEFEKIYHEIVTEIQSFPKEENREIAEEIYEFTSTNFPNPFNPETTINFSLPEPSNVQIDVFNVRGQRVLVLLNDNLNRGHHSVVWNGFDGNGRAVGSGLYFYRIQTESQSIVKRMVLLK
ncbi:MAG: S8 family serine peptidase [Candidatus Cloacimonetes bacterium]|nr:S8 family serine peptidase [Candidatus Cloacimonadota bacterium]